MLGVTKTRFWQTKMLVCVKKTIWTEDVLSVTLKRLAHTNTEQLHGATDWPSLTVINGASGKQLTKRKPGRDREDVLYISHPLSKIAIRC